MKSKNILIILILIAVLVTLFYSMQDGGTSEAYRKEIEKERADKDDYMRNNSESPFADSVGLFTGLKYFDIDESFRIAANLVPVEEKKTITLATSDGLVLGRFTRTPEARN